MTDKHDVVDKIVSLRNNGMTQQQIADAIGKSRSFVQKKLSQSGGSGPRVVSVRATEDAVPAAVTPDRWGKAEGSLVGSSFGQIMRPANPEEDWIEFGLDGNSWRKYGKKLTLPMLSMMSPGINRATWDYLRLLDPGHEILVYKPGTEDIDEEAMAAIKQFIKERIEPRYSSTSGLIQQLNMGVLYRGALCAQLVLNEEGDEAREILIPDPIVIKFKAVDDEDAGRVWEPGIVINGEWESVKSPLFHYVPFDPTPGDPYGRSIISAATFPSIFMLGLLYDLRRVVAQQGFTRTDIKVVVEKAKEQIAGHRAELTRDEFGRKVNRYLEDISSMYSRLEPDDAFIHTDAVEVGNAAGAVKSDIIGGAVGLLEVLERLEVRALKTMPLMMGITDNVSEANANRQWEIFVQGVKHIQHYTETVLEGFFDMVLQVQGLQGETKFKFAEIRSSEMLRDENTMSARLHNAAFAEDRGYMSYEEASVHAVGHPPTGEPREEDVVVEGVAPEVEESDPAVTDSDGTDDGGPDDDGGGQSNFRKEEHVRFYRDNRKRAIRVTRLEMNTAVRYWSRMLGDDARADMLDAVVVSTVEQASEDSDEWYWVEEDRVFVYRGVVLDAEQSRDAYGAFRVNAERDMSLLFSEIGDGAMSGEVDRVMSMGWRNAKSAMIAAALLGVGGVNAIRAEDNDWIEVDLDEQYSYWSEFSDDVHESEEKGGFAWRAVLYLGAGYLLFEHGRGRSWGVVIPDGPPLHPGCDCYVEYGEDDEGPYATWLIDGDMCPDCRQLAGMYQRYRGR